MSVVDHERMPHAALQIAPRYRKVRKIERLLRNSLRGGTQRLLGGAGSGCACHSRELT